MATIRQWLLQIRDQRTRIRALHYKRLSDQAQNRPNPDERQFGNFVTAIMDAFNWQSTSEGVAFWTQIRHEYATAPDPTIRPTPLESFQTVTLDVTNREENPTIGQFSQEAAEEIAQSVIETEAQVLFRNRRASGRVNRGIYEQITLNPRPFIFPRPRPVIINLGEDAQQAFTESLQRENTTNE